jgi:hypothetical protein
MKNIKELILQRQNDKKQQESYNYTSVSKNDLPLPIYLDYQTVFDILAVLDDGLSQFQEIRTVYSDEELNEKGIKARAGGRVPLGFLSMEAGAGFNNNKNKTNSNTQEVSGRKVHTSVSLFARMRDILYANGFVKDKLDFNTLKPKTFVEFQANFQKLEES